MQEGIRYCIEFPPLILCSNAEKIKNKILKCDEKVVESKVIFQIHLKILQGLYALSKKSL